MDSWLYSQQLLRRPKHEHNRESAYVARKTTGPCQGSTSCVTRSTPLSGVAHSGHWIPSNSTVRIIEIALRLIRVRSGPPRPPRLYVRVLKRVPSVTEI